jgi:hypothetical protein
MSEKKRFLLRLDGEVYDALERWAAEEFRSVNSQIEYMLRQALARAGRLPQKRKDSEGPAISRREPPDPTGG